MRIPPSLLAALLAAASGCYSFVPVSPTEVSPGQTVRVRLTAAEAVRFQDLRSADPRSLEGTLVARDLEGLVLQANVGTPDRARGLRALVQEVSVPLSGVLDLDRKELDRTRTGIAIGSGIAALAVVVAVTAQGACCSEPPPGNEIPEARRIPLIRFALPLGGR